MRSERLEWPEDLFPLRDVSDWLATATSVAAGFQPPNILNVSWDPERESPWGLVARFTAGSSHFVVKCSKHAAAAGGPFVHDYLAQCCPGQVPTVVASSVAGDISWTVFETIEGPAVGELLVSGMLERRTTFSRLARSLADIQVRAAQGPIPGEIPRSRLEDLPSILLDLVCCAAVHEREWSTSGTIAAPPRDAVRQLSALADPVARAVDLLGAAPWPNSIDHVDLHCDNALLRGGHDDPLRDAMVVIDWEEAVVGFPACSLDRLLADARDRDQAKGPGRSPSERAAVEAYCTAIPWDRPDRRYAVVEQAVKTNAIAYAGQCLSFSQYFGHSYGNAKLMAFCIDRLLRAWAS